MDAKGTKIFDIWCLLGSIFVSFEKVFVSKYSQAISRSSCEKYACKQLLKTLFWKPIPLKACLNVALLLLPLNKINTVAEGKFICEVENKNIKSVRRMLYWIYSKLTRKGSEPSLLCTLYGITDAFIVDFEHFQHNLWCINQFHGTDFFLYQRRTSEVFWCF